ncbi:MAG: efflux RND transporter periplasmic adaptor subunit [Kofleriaceae bacterium]
MKRAVFALLLVACRGSHDEAGEKDHHDHAAEPDELPGQSVTVWADRVELFMEYDPLIVGRETSFAAHVTEMPTFKAVTAGEATLTIKLADGTTLPGTVDAPSNPGIFRPTITPTKPGACSMSMTVTSPQVTHSFEVGPCMVYADEAAARKALPDEPEPPGRISFLKEQQWKTDFALVEVAERDLQDGVRASAEIRPVAGREARLGAPSAGRVSLAEPVPLLGMPVTKGQLLATVSPRVGQLGDRSTMAADVAAAQAELEAAKSALARAERLVAAQAAPAKTVEEARTRVQVAEARLTGTRGRLAQFDAGASGGAGGGRVFQVRSPIDGTLVSVDAGTGESVEEGQSIFRVVDLSKVWLVANVFEPDLPRVEGARSAWFTIEGYPQAFVIDETNGKLVTIGRVIDPRTRTTPVIFEVDNKSEHLRIGNFARAVIATGPPKKGLAVPDSAIVDDAGKSIVFVMIEGEAFERRPVRLGIRANGWVEVLEGVAAKEHVVTKGAYEIKLQSSSGAVPAHGHVH